MKLKLIIAVIMLGVSIARANLIDLTPGGFDETQPWPTVVQHFFGTYGMNQNLAAASVENAQVVWSPFTPFGPNQFAFSPSVDFTQAGVDWNLDGTGFHLEYIFVESSQLIAHLYAVGGDALNRIFGDGFVEVNGTIPILSATFVGSDRVPDSGWTIALLGIAMLTVVAVRRVYV